MYLLYGNIVNPDQMVSEEASWSDLYLHCLQLSLICFMLFKKSFPYLCSAVLF